jgi:peptide/nickel transport system permease protein
MSSDLDVVAGTAELAAPTPGTDHPHVPVPTPSRWRDVFVSIVHAWSGRIGLALAALIVVMAVFAPVIAPYGPTEILTDPAANERTLEKPCVHVFGCPDTETQHLMGLDENGRDEFSRVVYGARISLLAGAATVGLAVLFGTAIGLVAGFFGRRLDNVLMRCMDVLLSFPSLLLAILIVTVLGRGLINSVLAIAIVSVPAYARVVRGQVLSVREQDFITADRALGVRNRRLLMHRVFPNTLTPLIVQGTLGFATAVLEIAGLGFLGLGVQPPDAEWGTMISAAYRNIFNSPHLVFFPGVMIFLNVLAFNLLGDALRDALDPRSTRR